MKQRLSGLLAILFVFLTTFSMRIVADPVIDKQAQLLFHALFFIDWPNNHAESLNLCVLAADKQTVAHKLQQYHGLRTKRHAIDIHFIEGGVEAALEYNREFECQLFYFDNIYSGMAIKPILQLSYGQAILTLGHGQDFIAKGGMLSIAGDSVKRSKLLTSTQLNSARLITVDKRLLAEHL